MGEEGTSTTPISWPRLFSRAICGARGREVRPHRHEGDKKQATTLHREEQKEKKIAPALHAPGARGPVYCWCAIARQKKHLQRKERKKEMNL